MFCVNLGHTPTETLRLLKKSNSAKCCRTIDFKWHERYRNGHESINDNARSGRPRSVSTTARQKIEDILEEDRRVTVRSLADDVGASTQTVLRILRDDLKMRKCSARWVPRLLSTDDRSRRVAASKLFLRRYKKEGEEFLDRIITTDETWIWNYDPESKLQSSIWKTPEEPTPRKAKVSRSGGKHMFVFFADRRGMILQHRVPEGQTVNADYYSKVNS